MSSRSRSSVRPAALAALAAFLALPAVSDAGTTMPGGTIRFTGMVVESGYLVAPVQRESRMLQTVSGSTAEFRFSGATARGASVRADTLDARPLAVRCAVARPQAAASCRPSAAGDVVAVDAGIAPAILTVAYD